LAPCTRLNWQFSVSFQVHVQSSLSYRIVSYVFSTKYRDVPLDESQKAIATSLTDDGWLV